MKTKAPARFAICLNNAKCEDLVIRKIYRVLPDKKAEQAKHLRVIDESGEDYLYPATYFFVIELPQKIERSLRSPATIS